MKDGVCAVCVPPTAPGAALEVNEPENGYCTSCGFFFDRNGMRILDPTVTCRVHSPITAGCPHSGSLRR